ncbi:hypothetical protein [Lyngbya sp. PCC 8106]|uniref:hypothetical protein n=1 Tax=Lyngbya sp. (strain PCC 8106) TaxID=313612 RepID=UPI0000EAD159|nr:hypothetical protein [Lyngbya sp. PCC 8106]EAW38281.1 hypothetical protein L8106_09666 [Lyngbya sp. PCC 8106]
MKNTVLFSSLILSASLTLSQAISWSSNSTRFSLNQLTSNGEIIVYEATDEDGNREDVKTKQNS